MHTRFTLPGWAAARAPAPGPHREIMAFVLGMTFTVLVGFAWLAVSALLHPVATTEYVCRHSARLVVGVSADQDRWTTAQRVDVMQHYLVCMRAEGHMYPTLPADLVLQPK
jgi:hypothetical protein